MRLEKVGRVELVYTDIDVEFPAKDGGQMYGLLQGTLEVGELRGKVHATNLARERPDGQYTPALRGIFTTEQGDEAFFTMDGLSIRVPGAQPPRRAVTTCVTLWSAAPRLRPWNDALLLTEMVGGAMGRSWGVAGTVHRCIPEV